MSSPAPTPAAVPPPRPRRISRRRPVLRRLLVVAALTVLFGFGGLSVLALVGAQSGVTGTLLGITLSILVIGIVVPVFLWLDRFESEPAGLLVFAFLWGACIATIGAAFLNDLGGYLLGATDEGNTVVAVLVAPIVEESLKALGPLLLLWFRRREIDGLLDGIVYAGLTACGFAFVEDIIYLADGYAESGEEGLLGTFVVRVLMSPFAHPMFTVCTGIGIGIAATRRSWSARIGAPFAGWLAAVVLHALWNGAAVLSADGWLLTYVLVQVPLFIGFLVLLVWARRREAAKITQHLRGYTATGWLTPAEAAMFGSLPERKYARQWALSHGGNAARARMVDLQEAGSELALVRARIERGLGDERTAEQERELLGAVSALRQEFLGTAIYRRFEVLGRL